MSVEADAPLDAGDSAATRSLLRRIANVVVQAIMGSRAGLRIDRGRLLQVVEDRLPDLIEGTRLRFDPVLQALLRVEGVNERDLYLGIVNLSVHLAHMGIELEPPKLGLDHATRLGLLEAARSEAEENRRASREAELRRRISRLRARKLGDLLVEEGLVSGAQLAEALEGQKRFGGRLGTNLVERGHLSEIELAHFLSVQLGVPSVTRLDQISTDARLVLPIEVASKHRVVPTRVEADEVHLAMADPLDIDAIDAVAGVTGRRVFPVVAPELLISYALERSYGIRRAPRVVDSGRVQSLLPDKGTGAGYVGTPTGVEPADETLDLPALGARLAWVDADATIFELVQSYFEQKSSISAVFVAEGQRLRGWSHRGGNVSQARFRDAWVELSGDGVLSEIGTRVEPYVGPGCAGEGDYMPTELLALIPESRILGVPLRRGKELAGIALAHLDGASPGRDRGEEQRKFVQSAAHLMEMVRAALRMTSLRQEILRGAG